MIELEPEYSEKCRESLAVMAIVGEMAVADGWDSLDECFAENAQIIDTYMRLADAALRAIRRFNKTETAH